MTYLCGTKTSSLCVPGQSVLVSNFLRVFLRDIYEQGGIYRFDPGRDAYRFHGLRRYLAMPLTR